MPILNQLKSDLKEDIISYIAIYKSIQEEGAQFYEDWKNFDTSEIEQYESRLEEIKKETVGKNGDIQ